MGHQITIDHGTNTTDRTYNVAGKLLTESYTGGILDGMTITNTYDSIQRRSRLESTLNAHLLTSTLYTLDAASRLRSVSMGTNTATYSYLSNSSLIERITFTHGDVTNMTTVKSFDLINRLTEITHEDFESSVVIAFDYGYNSANQQTSVTNSDGSYWSYTYDSLGQLATGKQRDDQDVLLADRQFEYDHDDIGNRKVHRFDGNAFGVLQSTNTYTANLLNQYTNISGAMPTYDDDGNLTNDTAWIYTWDGENRLAVLESSTNIAAASRKKLEFAYDHQGRRSSKTVSTWNVGTSDWDLSYERHFLYDGWNLIAELDGSTNLLAAFVWGADLSGSEQGAGGVGGLLLVKANGSPHFVAHDGNGNVIRLMDAASGDVSASYEYGPFGESINASGEMASVNPFRIATKYTDDESGLQYYGHRYYNSSSGRWLNRDPIKERGGENLYSYCMNRPNYFLDYLGMGLIIFNPRDGAPPHNVPPAYALAPSPVLPDPVAPPKPGGPPNDPPPDDPGDGGGDDDDDDPEYTHCLELLNEIQELVLELSQENFPNPVKLGKLAMLQAQFAADCEDFEIVPIPGGDDDEDDDGGGGLLTIIRIFLNCARRGVVVPIGEYLPPEA